MLALPNCFSNSALIGSQRGDELGLVHVLDHGHALGAQLGHALGIVFVHARAVGLGRLFGGIQEGLLVGRD
jgi:3-dehydroquinate synthetase